LLNVNVDDFEVKMQEMYPKYMASIFDVMGISIKYELMPITRIHLYSDNAGEPEPTGSIIYVYIFGLVALFLILIATMNYMNLATARSARRAKEIGLRKVVGSSRGALILQFLIESITLTVISLIICSLLMILLLPSFNLLAGKTFDASILVAPVVLVSIIGLIILIGVISGCYPAFYLSKFSPIMVMKTGSISSKSGSLLRKTLVVLQFSISIAMIVCTLVVYSQLDHLGNMDQGWNMENVICLSLPNNEEPQNMTLLKQSLLNGTDILSAGSTKNHIGEGSGKGVFFMETSEGMLERGVNWTHIDHDFIETMDIQMVKGRDFSKDIPSDIRLGVIINQTLANRMGWKEPLGKKVERGHEGRLRANVVGVIKDYHQTGMYNEVESLLMQYRVDNPILYVKLRSNTVEALAFVEEVWSDIFPDHPFNYEFINESFEEQFTADRCRGTVFTLFTALAIFIACLGLFGLVSYEVEKRKREIGIRKILGASAGAIVRLISKEFLFLIIISMAIAFPISWYFMNNWLDNFVYSISMGFMLFAIPGLIALVLTVVTVSYQALQAANTNPVDTIKNI
jgi:putative ABC transport system permease protein